MMTEVVTLNPAIFGISCSLNSLKKRGSEVVHLGLQKVDVRRGFFASFLSNFVYLEKKDNSLVQNIDIFPIK